MSKKKTLNSVNCIIAATEEAATLILLNKEIDGWSGALHQAFLVKPETAKGVQTELTRRGLDKYATTRYYTGIHGGLFGVFGGNVLYVYVDVK